jgi:hypothetical protein
MHMAVGNNYNCISRPDPPNNCFETIVKFSSSGHNSFNFILYYFITTSADLTYVGAIGVVEFLV